MTEMTRLERRREGNVGNLGFLPIEICDKIYALILTAFEPTEIKQSDGDSSRSAIQKQLADFTRAKHSIDTAILRTSRNIYCEAYDLMVKKNSFVHVYSQGVPRYLLGAASVPIVTTVPDHVNRFRGYVLKVSMTFPDERAPGLQPYAHKFFNAMMLAADLDKLCLGLMEGDLFIPGFKGGSSLTLYLGTMITVSPITPDFENVKSLEQWFSSEKKQKEITQPFYDSLKDFENVQVSGLVLSDIVDSFSNRTTSDEWSSPQNIVDYLKTQEETGQQQLEAGKDRSACNTFTKAVCEMSMMQSSAFWTRLTQEGGQHFVTSLATLWFCFNLHCATLNMDAVGNEAMVTGLVENLLKQAHMGLSQGQWEPTRGHSANLHFLMARFLRLRGDREDIHRAYWMLQEAMRLVPDEIKYSHEHDELLAWHLRN